MIDWLVYLYVIGLHTSMAAMEILVWALALAALIPMVRQRSFAAFPLLIPGAALVVVVAIGLLINPPGRGFWFSMGFMRWLIPLYLVSQLLRRRWSPEFEKRLVQVWAGIFALAALYALLQTFTGIDLIRPSEHVVAFEHGIYRPVGFFSRSLAFAYSFGFAFFALSLPATRQLKRPLAWLVIGLGVVTLLATESRGAWLGFVAATAFYLACEHRRYLAGFAAAVAGTAFLLARTSTDIGIKIHNLLHMDLLHASIDHSGDLRMHNWQAYWAMFKDHPLFGVGLLQGDLLVPSYFQKLGIHEDFVSNAHNVYLQWLAGGGIFALALYLWICAYFLRCAWRLRHSTPWGWSILCAQIFLHVGAFTENNFFTAITNHMVIFNWAILLALCSARPHADGAPRASK